MNINLIIKKAIKISEIKIINIFFLFLETIVYWHYNKNEKKGKKINKKFFELFQIFSTGKLYTFHRRQLHKVLVKTLDQNSEIDKKIYDLTNKSYVKLFDISELEAKNTVEYFFNQKIYNSHVPFNEDFPNKLISVKEFMNTNDCHYGSFDIQTSLNSTILKKICLNKTIWKIAKKYLNSSETKIYSINTMLTKQSEKKNYVINMHKDHDCAGSLVVFIYWTEVSKLNGATRILPGNHLFLHDKKLQNYIGESLVDYLEGKGGSVFALDTWALHAGNPNITSPRLVTWIRFSSMPAKTYYRDNNYLYKDSLDEINHD